MIKLSRRFNIYYNPRKVESVTIDITCPNCGKKAAFHAELVPRKYHPIFTTRNDDGYMTCTHCGSNKKHHFTLNDYYYQIEVGDRILYARTLDNLKALQEYFRLHYTNRSYKTFEPGEDFPAEFYLRKDEIVRKIDQRIEKEKESR